MLGFYVDSKAPYLEQTCYIGQVPCRAEEAKFGGVVVQLIGSGMPSLQLKQVQYDALNARQQENYNFQKLSAILADFGFITHRLSDDWNGADMIAQHIYEDFFFRIQLKGRLTFSKKYQGKEIWIAFRKEETWFLYPHDAVLKAAFNLTNVANTDSWITAGGYSFPNVPEALLPALSEYELKLGKV